MIGRLYNLRHVFFGAIQVDLRNWLVVATRRDESRARGFIDEMKRVCRHMDIEVRNPVLRVLDNDRTESYLKSLRENINREVMICRQWITFKFYYLVENDRNKMSCERQKLYDSGTDSCHHYAHVKRRPIQRSQEVVLCGNTRRQSGTVLPTIMCC